MRPSVGNADVDLSQFRCFIAVVETGSFTGAARRLHVTQPTVSRAVQRLESALNARLLDRSTRHLSLTPEGRAFHADLTEAYAHLDRAISRLHSSSVLRIGFCWLLPEQFSRFVARFAREAGVDFEFVRDDTATAGLDDGRTHAALLRRVPRDRPVTALPLWQEPRVAAVARTSPLARRDHLDWAELADWPLVRNAVSGTTAPELWPPDRRPAVGAVCGNYDEWLEAVAADQGIGTVPEPAARRTSHPSVVYVPLRKAPPVQVSLALPLRGAHPLAERLAAAAGREFRRSGGSAEPGVPPHRDRTPGAKHLISGAKHSFTA
ncbi:LysR family transcriptional regulator [Streptomyces sp. VNUA116]|uniref:LysR family transcriptional regulator n=1 Tax=Streptomyces sp. VNUA116 TaxID=3062449 RepID=UPI0026755BA2|nr:LysR family transcriptional regulator [Streptomyces sp. VNUA116]WKU48377.1 LysR family transcriptional regulator [Streptomyces sp. VNUA116]